MHAPRIDDKVAVLPIVPSADIAKGKSADGCALQTINQPRETLRRLKVTG